MDRRGTGAPRDATGGASSGATGAPPGDHLAVDLDRRVLGDRDAGLRREWLVTNGLGGYASATALGVPTRAYHGYLVAALQPPVDRTVLVAGLLEWVDGAALHALERQDGSFEGAGLEARERQDGPFDGDGPERLERLRLEGSMPVWTFALPDGRAIERRTWMEHGASTTYLRYELLGDGAAVLELEPLVTFRGHDRVDRPPSDPVVEALPDGLHVRFEGGPPVAARAAGVAVTPGGEWRGPFELREQAARGEGERAEAFRAGRLRGVVRSGQPLTLVLSAEPDADTDGEAALDRARARDADLLARARATAASAFVRQLVLAADAFVVERRIPRPGGPAEVGRTIIAGYPWFTDWGRDTMIALAGLTLATGRADDGATILRSFGRFIRRGLLPNVFPDHEDQPIGYHTIDASLWYPVAIERHRLATGDESLVDELLPVLRDILEAHIRGTDYGIGMDPADGLIRGAAAGYQLTWMDAKVEDWVVTPRRGKPVEIQALWVNALRIVAGWLRGRGSPEAADRYDELAGRAGQSFGERFWSADRGWLADVVDGPAGDEVKLRPNQLFALSLPHPLVDQAAARSILAAVERELVTPFGLRSLAPSEPDYRPRFMGDRWFRDAGYHQGAVWAWLIGPYADALVGLGDRDRALDALRPFHAHLADAGLGSISEVFEPEPPFEPRGCIAQAWSVAEVLRGWRALTGE